MPYKPQATSTYAGHRSARVHQQPALPGQYRSKIKPMLAQTGKKTDVKDPKKLEQFKWDGTRIIVIKEYDNIRIMGARNWVNNYAPLYPEIVTEVKQLPVDCGIWDGELVFVNKKSGQVEFVNAVSKRVKMEKGKDLGWGQKYDAKAVLFDVLFIDSDDIQTLPFEDRDEIVKTSIPKNLKHVLTSKTFKSAKEKEQFQAETVRKQQEGVMLKDAGSPYRQDYRSPEWLKVKNWKSDECVVVGYTEGNGARAKTFGALILAQYGKDGKLHYVGKTAGLKNAETLNVLQKLKTLKAAKSALAAVPADVGQVQGWVQPKMVVEVKYLERTQANNLLRMPDFLRERKRRHQT